MVPILSDGHPNPFVFQFADRFVPISQFDNVISSVVNVYSFFIFNNLFLSFQNFIFISQFKDVSLSVSNFSSLDILDNCISKNFWIKYDFSMSIYDFEKCDVQCSHYQTLHWKTKMKMKNIFYSKCCKNGKINLFSIFEFFSLLRELFTAATPQTRQFWKIIWKYNNTIAFTFVIIDSNKWLKFNFINSQFFWFMMNCIINKIHWFHQIFYLFMFNEFFMIFFTSRGMFMNVNLNWI